MSNKKTPTEEVLEGIDFADLALQLSQLALKAMSGKEIETVSYDVQLDVPIEIAKVVETMCMTRDIDAETIFATMASENFYDSIRKKVQEETSKKGQDQQTQDVAAQVAAATGFDTSKMMEGMTTLQGFAETLQGLQGVLTNANQTTNTTNHNQPNVPSGTVPGNKTRKE